jgi:hypothetical protein
VYTTTQPRDRGDVAEGEETKLFIGITTEMQPALYSTAGRGASLCLIVFLRPEIEHTLDCLLPVLSALSRVTFRFLRRPARLEDATTHLNALQRSDIDP